MNRYLLAFSCLIAVTYAQCPPDNCPPPTPPLTPCGAPDCSILSNRYRIDALFPHPDPNYYWQCAPLNATHWAAAQRQCACSTVFNPFENPPRCTFWFDRTWQPICNWQNPPTVIECPIWCPDCNENGPGPTDIPEPPIPDPPGPPTCPCPCPPCIWWPCVPCTPVNNCPCNNRG